MDVLRLSARNAVFSGRSELASRHLRRALEERLTSGRRVAVLLQLAHAEFQVDPPAAAQRVREAVDTIGNRETAAFIAIGDAAVALRRPGRPARDQRGRPDRGAARRGRPGRRRGRCCA